MWQKKIKEQHDWFYNLSSILQCQSFTYSSFIDGVNLHVYVAVKGHYKWRSSSHDYMYKQLQLLLGLFSHRATSRTRKSFLHGLALIFFTK